MIFQSFCSFKFSRKNVLLLVALSLASLFLSEVIDFSSRDIKHTTNTEIPQVVSTKDAKSSVNIRPRVYTKYDSVNYDYYGGDGKEYYPEVDNDEYQNEENEDDINYGDQDYLDDDVDENEDFKEEYDDYEYRDNAGDIAESTEEEEDDYEEEKNENDNLEVEQEYIKFLAKSKQTYNNTRPVTQDTKVVIEKFQNKPRDCDVEQYLSQMGHDLSKIFVTVTNCTNVWIKTTNLSVSSQLKIFNIILSQMVKRAYAHELERKETSKAELIQHFEDELTQPGGFVYDKARFDLMRTSQYITTITLLPSQTLPEKNKPYFNTKDFLSSQLIKQYFPCTASGKAARWSEAKEGYNMTCSNSLDVLENPKPFMDPRFYSYHGWIHNFRQRPSPYGKHATFSRDWNLNCPFCDQAPNFVTYVHVIQNAMLFYPAVGYQIDDKLKIIQLQCKPVSRAMPFFSSAKRSFGITHNYHRQVVFSIAVNWQGNKAEWNIYHTLGESLSKLAVYADFLRANPHIAVHVQHSKPAQKIRRIFLKHWHLTNKVVYGNTLARVLIFPEGNPCFQPAFYYMQTSQHYLAKSLRLNNPKPDSILYIQRTVTRQIQEEEDILTFLNILAQRYNLTLQVFSDTQVPAFHEIAQLFHSSLLTIGAHGAGLTNMLFMQPRTAVFEIVCQLSPATFIHMTHKLGLRHHAFYANRIGIDRCDKGVSVGSRMTDFLGEMEQLLKIVLQDPVLRR